MVCGVNVQCGWKTSRVIPISGVVAWIRYDGAVGYRRTAMAMEAKWQAAAAIVQAWKISW